MPVLQTTEIVTDRLRLRPGSAADVEAMIETQTDPRVRRYLGGPRPADQVRAYISDESIGHLVPGRGNFVVADAHTDQMLGLSSLSYRSRDLPGHVTEHGEELQLTYLFRTIAWGHGYATEACRALLHAGANELPDQPVIAITQVENHASLNVAAQLGFVETTQFDLHEARQSLLVAPLAAFANGHGNSR